MRYLILILLNLPVIGLSLLNIIVNHKVKKTPSSQLHRQLLFWLVILLVIMGTFPTYNYLTNQPLLTSDELSLFDIAEITTIVALIYKVSSLSRAVDENKGTVRDLHQKLSIALSKK